jgi:hypothetical protein
VDESDEVGGRIKNSDVLKYAGVMSAHLPFNLHALKTSNLCLSGRLG